MALKYIGPSKELAIERVKTRVLEGGHNIEDRIIRMRYVSGLKNLFEIYLPIFDEVMIFDNSDENPELIAEKQLNTELEILNQLKYKQLKNY